MSTTADYDLGFKFTFAEIDGDFIRRERRRRHWTANGLADRAGVGYMTISRIEAGHTYSHTDRRSRKAEYTVKGVSADTLAKVAEALDRDLEDLLLPTGDG